MSFNFSPPRYDQSRYDQSCLAQPVTACPTVLDRRRPRLLLSAARHGLALYRRDRDLPRLLPRAMGQPPLDALTEAEARAETARRGGEATYSFARHIDLLIALLAEQRLARQP